MFGSVTFMAVGILMEFQFTCDVSCGPEKVTATAEANGDPKCTMCFVRSTHQLLSVSK